MRIQYKINVLCAKHLRAIYFTVQVKSPRPVFDTESNSTPFQIYLQMSELSRI